MRDFSIYRKLEFQTPDSIRETQETILREHLRYCSRNSPYYKKIFSGRGQWWRGFTLENLPELPFTDKSRLEKYNDAFLAVPPRKIVDIVLSSGTTGQPTRIAYTESDLRRLAYNEEQSFHSCGMTAEDRVLLTCTLDRCFVAGFAYFSGVRAVGAAAIRSGLNSLESHGETIRRLHPTVIVGVPTFLRKLGLYLRGQGVKNTGVRMLVCIGEPLRGADMRFLALGRDLERVWGAKAYSTYSSSEIISSFCECTSQQGGHLHPELAAVEIIDEAGNPRETGFVGELVVTPLMIEGMPLIRFKTGDISFLIPERCRCGRRSLRLGPIMGRKQQMMKIRGTTVYPQAVFSVLEEIGRVAEYCISVRQESPLSDAVTVHAAVTDRSCSAAYIKEQLQARLRVRPEVIVEEEEILRGRVYNGKSRKPVRFFDYRR
ncbi:MAG: AMP-binding protein [Candidatus Omnitrophica bacterium]|nr:AMP-binding protein [Candidatus Omnitrophota bacterium]